MAHTPADVISIAKSAKNELIIVSPYFVPGALSLQMLRDLPRVDGFVEPSMVETD